MVSYYGSSSTLMLKVIGGLRSLSANGDKALLEFTKEINLLSLINVLDSISIINLLTSTDDSISMMKVVGWTCK